MVGRGDDYEAAATKMIETALVILEINKRLHERRVALLASAQTQQTFLFAPPRQRKRAPQ
jgi:hypothetical protein